MVLSDYGSGLITPAIARTIHEALARRSKRGSVPMLVDSRYRLLEYRDMTICTPNESEVEQMLGLRIGDDVRTLEQVGPRTASPLQDGGVADYSRQSGNGALPTESVHDPRSNLRI